VQVVQSLVLYVELPWCTILITIISSLVVHSDIGLHFEKID